MQILDNEQNGPPRGTILQPFDQCSESLFSLPRGSQRKRRKPIRCRQREQRGPQRHDLRPGHVVLFQAFEQPVEASRRRVLSPEIECPLEIVDRWVQPGVLKIGRAAPLDHRRIGRPLARPFLDVFLQRVDEPRFPQAGLSNEEHNLPHPLLSLFPAILEQADFVIATGERRKFARRRRVNQTGPRGDSVDAEKLNGAGRAFYVLPAQARALKATPKQLVRVLGANELAGHGQVLQAEGDVSRLSDQRDGLVLRLDDRLTGMQGDEGIQFQPMLAAELFSEFLQPVEQT